MKRMHALIIAAALGIAVVLGSFAAMRTTHAASAPTVTSSEVARQNRALDRAESALRAELRQRPARTAAPTIVYHRPPPVVHVVHRHGGESEDGREFDD